MVNKLKEWMEALRFWWVRVTSDVPMYEDTGDDFRPVDLTSEMREQKRKRRVAKSKGKAKRKVKK